MSATTNKDPSVRASGQGKDITFWDKLDLVPGYLTVSQSHHHSTFQLVSESAALTPAP